MLIISIVFRHALTNPNPILTNHTMLLYYKASNHMYDEVLAVLGLLFAGVVAT